MPILDANTLAAARAVTDSTLDDSITIYSPSVADNGLVDATTYGLRDVRPCRAVSMNGKDVSDALRLLNKQLYRVTVGSDAVIFLNEKVVITGSVNITGHVVQENLGQTDPLVAGGFVVAEGA